MIVKIQREMSRADKTVLIYSRSRSIHRMEEFTDEHKRILGDELKVYYEISMTDGRINFLRPVATQNW